MESKVSIRVFSHEDETRLNDILTMIGNVAALDFTKTLTVSKENDMIDAIALGLNMLSEELKDNVVEKAKLDFVNKKLEKFAITAAHDLKSPMNAISGLLFLVEYSLSSRNLNEAQEHISKMKSVLLQMQNLVKGILDYSHATQKTTSQEDINLKDLLREIIDADQFDEHAIIELSNDLPNFAFNRTHLVQVFRNLIDNAIKYNDKDICKIRIESEERSDHYLISVIDNGPGIDSEYQEVIFELFKQVSPNSNSASKGIGLSTVKDILENAGSRIWVESSPGKSTLFRFTIPKNLSNNEKS